MSVFFKKSSVRAFDVFRFFAVGMFSIAFGMVSLLVTLSLLLLAFQEIAILFGLHIEISEEIKKTILAICGAICVALVALYGVRSQNLSAESRHRIDANLQLKKDVFIEVSVAFALQFQHLVSIMDPSFSEEDRRALTKESASAHARLQMVASQDTIMAMLKANQMYSFALVKMGPPLPANASLIERARRFKRLHDVAAPFMEEVWKCNIIARSEIGSDFQDSLKYLEDMRTQFAQVKEMAEGLEALVERMGDSGRT
jgi:hypothetical protein